MMTRKEELKNNIVLDIKPRHNKTPQKNWLTAIIFLFFSKPHLWNSKTIFWDEKEFMPYIINDTPAKKVMIWFRSTIVLANIKLNTKSNNFFLWQYIVTAYVLALFNEFMQCIIN